MRKNAKIFKKYKNTQNLVGYLGFFGYGYGNFLVFGFGFGYIPYCVIDSITHY